MQTNTLYFGDNIHFLSQFPSESVDLVYLDPPFSSARNYFMNFRDPAGNPTESQSTAFFDTWTWTHDSEAALRALRQDGPASLFGTLDALHNILGPCPMMAYIVSMASRLKQMHRVLKPTGSLWLHCDPTAGAYLRLLLDGIFGPQNFRNEIVWKRQSAHSDAKRKLADVMDTIYFYGKSDAVRFFPQYTAHDPEYVKEFYKFDDGDGRGKYRHGDMTSPNPRPNLMYEWQGFASPKKGWRYSLETIQKLHDEGRIHYPKLSDGTFDTAKRPALKRFLSEQEGSIVTNIWTDIPPVQARGEALGYPTQKPLALLRRILALSSQPGDIVLDPYCGCGTAVVAAHEMGRRWVGIDVSPLATKVMEERLRKGFDDLAKYGVPVKGMPETLDQARALAERDRSGVAFQQWACHWLLGAQAPDKKGADRGIDGWKIFYDADGKTHRVVVQVKSGKNISSGDVRDFCHVVAREKAAVGVFVTLLGDDEKDFSHMKREAVSAGTWTSFSGVEYPRVQILTVGDVLSGRSRLLIPMQDDRTLGGYYAPKHRRQDDQGVMPLF